MANTSFTSVKLTYSGAEQRSDISISMEESPMGLGSWKESQP